MIKEPEMSDKKAISRELLNQLVADYKKPEDLIGEHGLFKQLTKALVERDYLDRLRD